jgi:hypothetical protein
MMANRGKSEAWESHFKSLLPVFGHRNWIVAADSAYPAQSKPGIETILTGSDHEKVLRTVIRGIDASSHIRANVYIDAELKLVPEADAPGVSSLRNALARQLAGRSTHELTHDRIISRLDQAAQTFRILILKSTLAIPYTSVFFELDCQYWSEDAEKRMRNAKGRQ